MDLPPHLQPFVLDARTRKAERHGPTDLYLPDEAARPAPAVVFVHGGPIPAAPPGWDDRFRLAQAVAKAGDLPIVLTRAGLERPAVAATVATFVDAAHACNARLEIIDVPNGQHGFDTLDHTANSRAAVTRALDLVLGFLR